MNPNISLACLVKSFRYWFSPSQGCIHRMPSSGSTGAPHAGLPPTTANIGRMLLRGSCGWRKENRRVPNSGNHETLLLRSPRQLLGAAPSANSGELQKYGVVRPSPSRRWWHAPHPLERHPRRCDNKTAGPWHGYWDAEEEGRESEGSSGKVRRALPLMFAAQKV